MATTTIYNNALVLMANGNMKFPANGETYKVLLLKPDSTYAAVKSHVNVSEVVTTNEVAASGGYTTGGQTVGTITVGVLSGTNTIGITIPDIVWGPSTTIATKAAVIYKVGQSGTYTDAKLLAYVDFGSTITSSNSALTISFSSPLKLVN